MSEFGQKWRKWLFGVSLQRQVRQLGGSGSDTLENGGWGWFCRNLYQPASMLFQPWIYKSSVSIPNLISEPVPWITPFCLFQRHFNIANRCPVEWHFFPECCCKANLLEEWNSTTNFKMGVGWNLLDSDFSNQKRPVAGRERAVAVQT